MKHLYFAAISLTISSAVGAQQLPLGPLPLDINPSAFTALGDFSGAPGRVAGLVTTLAIDPQPLLSLGSGTGLPLVLGLSPALETLVSDPATLLTFIAEGGTLLNSSLAAVPDLPFISEPLPGL
ncbi:hypothetical protein GCM10027567_08400 [Spongiibacter taiwanensis]